MGIIVESPWHKFIYRCVLREQRGRRKSQLKDMLFGIGCGYRHPVLNPVKLGELFLPREQKGKEFNHQSATDP